MKPNALPSAEHHLRFHENEVAELFEAIAQSKRGTAGRLRDALGGQGQTDAEILARPPTIDQARLTIARESGFADWPALEAAVRESPARMLYSGDGAGIVRQPLFTTTHIGALQGISDFYGLGHTPATIFGATGHAFMMNIHFELCPSGPLLWRRGGFYRLLSNLGIDTEDLGFFFQSAPRKQRSRVEARLCEALDAGLPCSLCNMEFQLISGYDDAGFLLTGPYPDHLRHRLTFGTWEQWGDEAFAYFFIHRKAAVAPRVDMVRDSLAFAVALHQNPDDFALKDYAAGPKAYDNWHDAIDTHGEIFGHLWNIDVWSECREYAARYLTEIAEWFPQVADLATQLSEAYASLATDMARLADASMTADDKKHLLLDMKQREGLAVSGLERLLAAMPEAEQGNGYRHESSPLPLPPREHVLFADIAHGKSYAA